MVSVVEGNCTTQCSPTLLSAEAATDVGGENIGRKEKRIHKNILKGGNVIPYSLMEMNTVYIIFHDRELNCGTLLFWIRWVARMAHLNLQHVIIKYVLQHAAGYTIITKSELALKHNFPEITLL